MDTHPLRLWRLSKKKTLIDVCDVLNIHPGYLSELERGLKVPSLQLAIKIMEMTKNKVKPSSFLEEKK